MDDRRNLGLKGPVRRVTEEWQPPFSSRKELAFGRDGMLVAALPRVKEVREGRGGVRVEVHSLAGLDGWSIDGLNGVCFLTLGATAAETSYTSDGTPVETVFKGEHNNEISRVRYVCDDKGRIVEARQHNLTDSPLPPRMAALPGPEAETMLDALRNFGGPEADLRVAFVYDQGDHVLEQSQYFGERLHQQTVSTYNEDGDRVTFSSSGEAPYRFEYEYDEWRNWTRQVVQHPQGSVECRRKLTYYD